MNNPSFHRTNEIRGTNSRLLELMESLVFIFFANSKEIINNPSFHRTNEIRGTNNRLLELMESLVFIFFAKSKEIINKGSHNIDQNIILF